MMECTDLIAGRTQRCNARCERALIGLISSDEGKELINCDCDGNKYCELSKQRIEVCRKSVYTAVAKDTIVSCSTARWICISDQLCKTALEYYQRFCRQLFIGQKCTHRCNNSLSILDRQEKASKLRTCYCDGTENFPCTQVKFYTEHMCYGRHTHNPLNPLDTWENEDDNGLDDNNDNSIEPIGHVGNNHHNSYYHNHHRYHHKLSNKFNNHRLRTNSAYSQMSSFKKYYQCLIIIIITILFQIYFHRLPAVFR